MVIVDDVLATGGTLEAAIKLVQRADGQVLSVVLLIEISALGGRQRLLSLFPQLKIHALVKV